MSPENLTLAVAEAARVGVGSLPPTTNRGVTVTWQALHWFSGTCRGLLPDDVLAALADHLNSTPQRLEHGGYGYQASARVGGASVYWSVGREDVFVVLPGEVCEVLGVVGVVAVATDLDLVPSSRLDLAWDLEGVAVADFQTAWHGGDVVTRAHRDSWQELRNADGNTFYMGSRASGRFVRVYDRRGPTRLEMEWKGERAVALWGRLLASQEQEWSQAALTELRAFVDFRERSDSVHPRLRRLLPWWALIVDGAGRDALCIPRKPASLESQREWLRQQVAPVLALVADSVPNWTEELAGLLRHGRPRYAAKREKVALRDAARSLWEVVENAAD